jgi:hypothetical protein
MKQDYKASHKRALKCNTVLFRFNLKALFQPFLAGTNRAFQTLI